MSEDGDVNPCWQEEIGPRADVLLAQAPSPCTSIDESVAASCNEHDDGFDGLEGHVRDHGCSGNVDGDDWCGEGGGPRSAADPCHDADDAQTANCSDDAKGFPRAEACNQSEDDGNYCGEHRALKALADANGCSDGINDADCWENGSRATAGFPGDLTASVLAGMPRG